MRFASGARLGPFEILTPLGAGGMGEVYRARDTRLDRTVAIKLLPSELLNAPGRRIERFRREARAIARITHPHICTLHDVGEDGPAIFLVMEYVEGVTLAARLEDGPLPLDLALRAAIQIADALDHAHRQGVVHADLKPGNIMLTRDSVKLLDFGLAKLKERDDETPNDATRTERLTEVGSIVGDGPVHGAGADRRARGRQPHRYFRVRRRPLRDALRPTAVCGRQSRLVDGGHRRARNRRRCRRCSRGCRPRSSG